MELIYKPTQNSILWKRRNSKRFDESAGSDLRSLVDMDEEADSYMNIVFELCTAYERQSYIEGMKVGMRLMAELMER